MNEKKLRLNKETIRNLSDENLEQVAGGKRKNGHPHEDSVFVLTSIVCCNEPSVVGCSVIC